MTSNPIKGASDPGKEPDTRSHGDQHRRIEKVEKISKVSETENEKKRRQKFRQFMEEDTSGKQGAHMPSPFETDFYTSASPSPPTSMQDLTNAAVPSPATSPPPNVTNPPSPSINSTPPLPKSPQFWSGVDAPPGKPIDPVHCQETASSQKRSQKKDKEQKETSAKQQAETQIQAQLQIVSTFPSTQSSKKDAEKTESNSILLPKKTDVTSKKNIFAAPQNLPEEPLKKNKEKKPISTPFQKETKKETPSPWIPAEKGVTNTSIPHEKSHEDRDQNGGKNPRALIVEDSSTPLFPPQFIPSAQEAVNTTTQYLTPETAPLFFNVVGTICMLVARPGVSQTDIVLNSPAFTNSRFFGATISIEKYATAPDSLNIRLTGSNEAVSLFNRNIPSLYAAFQNGKFGFRIGRISAEYTAERPVFRRKAKGEGRSGFEDGGAFKDRSK